jgi:hypothetical protein
VSEIGPLHKGKQFACDSALVYTSVIVFGAVRILYHDREKKSWFLDRLLAKHGDRSWEFEPGYPLLDRIILYEQKIDYHDRQAELWLAPLRPEQAIEMAAIRIGDCVLVPDRRVGRVRAKAAELWKVRLRRAGSNTHQLLTFQNKELSKVHCPKGWMRPEGYLRYLRITLRKMRERQAKLRRSK